MQQPNNAELQQFRQETRQWLDANCPQSMRTAPGPDEAVWGGRNAKFPNQDAKDWLDAMASRGWTVPRWPTEYGGGGLSFEQEKILQEEMVSIKARSPLQSFGIWMLGPVLLEFGSEEQKREHLPPIARGEIRWCQGYSEPGAGSDLAGLRTKCEDRGDHWLVNGQKIWTSYANHADKIFALVRTDFDAPKHHGISFLLIDMASEGVDTRPIKLISGASPFCETFFENVQVPKGNLVGEINVGWTIAKRLLQHERSMISGSGGGRSDLVSPEDLARRYRGLKTGSNSEIADPVLRQKIAHFKIEALAYSLMLQRTKQEKQPIGAKSSMFKYSGTELNMRRFELLVECMGNQGLGWEGNGFDDDALKLTRDWLRTKGNSIEGGTSEVQLNIVAKNVLELPQELSSKA